MDAKKYFMDKIGFLKWARVEGYFMENEGFKGCIISPDVHSLHLAWEEPDGEIRHEIADYPFGDITEQEILEWVDDEIGDDSWETYDPGTITLIEAANDYRTGIKDINELPVIKIG